MRLILFDIDGTLLRCGTQVRPLFVGALEEIFGIAIDCSGCSFAGKTDPLIALELARRSGLEDGEVLPRLEAMRACYVARLDRGLCREGMELLPGVTALLSRLAAREDVAVGLLTGNWRHGAEIKLSRFALRRFFAFGAFGDDGVERRSLLAVALSRAAALTGRTFTPEETLIVGDSLLDVDCAHAGGARCLAVATGFASAEELQAAGADWIFPDLSRASEAFPLFAA